MDNETEYLGNALLNKYDLADYDLDRTYYMVVKFLKEYKRLRCKSFQEPPMKVTNKYKYVVVNESGYNSNKYNVHDEIIDSESEYLKISKQISMVTDLFNEEEKVYFTISLLKGRSETTAYKEIGCSNKGLIPIKNSCIVKFACAFNLEVYKGNKLANDDEDKFRIMFNGN